MTDSVIPAARGGVYPDARVQAFADAMDAFDGYIVVTPEYNHGIPGGVKNAFDHLGPELNTKPVAFVSYGAERGSAPSSSGARWSPTSTCSTSARR
ncbi:NADPH-dependent FMN reductase [Tessaracoccus coleopterorum]|uniref:NADPH-dependent FMN reductase n=1 Tax=Tessaracoccus coleopterorum TaxID=2714950 RepID=UPI002F90D314